MMQNLFVGIVGACFSTLSSAGFPPVYGFIALWTKGLFCTGCCASRFQKNAVVAFMLEENAAPDVQRDLHAFFRRLVPAGDNPSMAWLTHTTEGADDMPAHIMAALTQTSIGIPVAGGALVLGRWLGIYLFEHRDRPHRRDVVLHLTG